MCIFFYIFINPLRMRRRVTVVCLSVCMCVCMSFSTLTARVLNSVVRVLTELARYSKAFDSWILQKALRSK